MDMTRRELIVLAGTVVISGCAHTGGSPGLPAATGPVDAGPLTGFAAGAADDRFAAPYGFFVVREGSRVFALSSSCTHRACLLSAVKGNGFRCKCHGSTFTLDGQVTRGPARRDLPRFAVERSPAAHLIVHVERPVLPADSENAPAGFVELG